jgi:cation transporter-like permease
MPPQPVPGFTTAGEAANSAVRLLALQLALNATVSALKLTEGNLSSLIGARPSDAVLMTGWRDQVRKALHVAENARA